MGRKSVPPSNVAIKTAKQRQAECRRRKRHNLILARVEVPQIVAERLADLFYLNKSKMDDPEEVGRALLKVVRRAVGR